MEYLQDSQPLGTDDKAKAIAALKAIKTEEENTPSPDKYDADTANKDAIDAMRSDGWGPSANSESQETTVAADTQETEAEPEKPGTPALTQEQQIKLRVREQANRIRQQALKEKEALAKERAEFEAERQRIAQEKADYERQKAEIEAMRKRAREAPKDFLAEVGKPLDELVREEIETGRPDARISNMERQIQLLVKEIQDRDKRAEEAAAQAKAEAERKAAEQAQAQQQAERQKAEQDFLKLSVEQAEKNPEIARLAKNKPMGALAMAYTAYHDFKEVEGREPTMAELVATAEKILAGEMGEEDAPAPKATRKGAVTKPSGGGTVVDISKMSEDEKRKLAIKEFKRLKGEDAKKAVL